MLLRIICIAHCITAAAAAAAKILTTCMISLPLPSYPLPPHPLTGSDDHFDKKNRATRVWEVATQEEVFTLQGDPVWVVAFDGSGRYIASGRS